MSNLPEFAALQQHHARPVSVDQLEALGKTAAIGWARGAHSTLSCAVVETVKCAAVPLAPEQVLRVIEFANVAAYLDEYKKEGSHRVIDFGEGGPASPSEVLLALNNGGSKTVLASTSLADYAQAPVVDAASDDALWASMFAKEASSLGPPEVNPYQDILELQDKLAAEHASVMYQITGLEADFEHLSHVLYGHVKQAALAGVSLGDVVQAWGTAQSAPVFVKAAFDQFVPRLQAEDVFSSAQEIGESISKVAEMRIVNKAHPLVETYEQFCDTLTKVAQLREYCVELETTQKQANTFLSALLKHGGVLGTLDKAHGVVAKGLRKGVGMGETSANLLGGALAYGVPAAATVGAVKYVKDLADDVGVTRHIPGTLQYDYMRAQRQGGGY